MQAIRLIEMALWGCLDMGKQSKVHAFTKRGKVFGNVWRVYSAKCDQDFSLSSDRELAHWILFLEFNPDVIRFDLNPQSRSQSPEPGAKRTILDAEVIVRGGAIEWHEIKEGSFDKDAESTPQIELQRELAKAAGVKYRVFNDDDFAPKASSIMPLLKVAACLAAGRHFFIPPAINLDVADYFIGHASGTLGEYLRHLNNHSQDALLYLFCQHYSLGKIAVEFESAFFAKNTKWTLVS